MTMSDRIMFLLIGCLIGFVLGYIVRSLRCKEERTISTAKDKNDRDDRRTSNWQNIVLVIVLGLTVWAAFSSQRSSNNVQDSQDKIARTTACSQQFLTKTITVLNERTTFTVDQANANVDLQRAQAEFLNVFLQKPAPSSGVVQSAFSKYVESLTTFISVSGKTAETVQANPYPTPEELQDCLDGKRTGDK